MNTDSTTTFTYHDPSRTFDGTPYEAAAQAVGQASRVLELAHRALGDADVQARNAFMSRNLDAGDDAGARNWENQPEAKALAGVANNLETMQLSISQNLKKLDAVARAVGYDPKNPPKEEA